MSEKKYDVLSLGIQCIDIVVRPAAAGVFDRELTMSEGTQMMLGGDALNQAVTLAKLGAKTAFMGVVGNDTLGSVLENQLREYPMTVLNTHADVKTAVDIVLIDRDGERHFIYQPDSNLYLDFDHIDPEPVKEAKILSIGSCLSLPGLDHGDMIRLLDLAHSAGTQTAMDFSLTNVEPDGEILREILRRTDYALPSELEAEALTGESKSPEKMVKGLREMGAGNCIIKLGSKGCYVAADGYEGLVPAFPSRCIDTTGAGDTFVGAFLYAKTRGWDIHRSALFANAAGSIAVEHTGANAAITSAQQVLERMNRGRL